MTPVTDQPAMTLLPCPSCDDGTFQPTREATAHCGSCGHRAAAALVAECASLDAYLTQATARRAWLWEQIATGTTAPTPAVGTAQPSPRSAQTVLFTLGGGLLALAGLVFLAVAWTALPLAGRAALMVAVSTALVGAGHTLRTKMTGTAETFTAVGVSLAAASLFSAPHLGLVGTGWDLAGHATWWAAMSALVATAAAVGMRASGLRTWVLTAPIAATITVLAAAVATGDASGEAVGFSLVAAAGGAALLLTPALAARTVTADRIGRALGQPRTGTLVGATERGGTVAVGIATISLGAVLFDRSLVPAYAALLMGVALLPAAVRYLTPGRVSTAAAHAPAGAASACAAALLLADEVSVSATSLMLAVAASTAVALVAITKRVPGSLGLPFAVAAAPLSVGFALAAPTHDLTLVLAIMTAGTALAATLGQTPVTGLPWRHWAWVAATAATATWWSWLADRDTLDGFPVEAWTAVPALILLAAGTGWAIKTRAATGALPGTDPAWLPALLAFTIPGGLAAIGEVGDLFEDTTGARAVLYLLLGAVLLAVGARTRTAAPFKAGAATVILTTIAHLFALGQILPGWVSLAAAGALVLTVAIRWEWLQTRRAVSATWVNTLR